MNQLGLNNRVPVVTVGGDGIGRAISECLLTSGEGD